MATGPNSCVQRRHPEPHPDSHANTSVWCCLVPVRSRFRETHSRRVALLSPACATPVPNFNPAGRTGTDTGRLNGRDPLSRPPVERGLAGREAGARWAGMPPPSGPFHSTRPGPNDNYLVALFVAPGRISAHPAEKGARSGALGQRTINIRSQARQPLQTAPARARRPPRTRNAAKTVPVLANTLCSAQAPKRFMR